MRTEPGSSAIRLRGGDSAWLAGIWSGRAGSGQLRRGLRGEGTVVEREPIASALALDLIPGRGALGERHDAATVRATHAMGDRGDPHVPFDPHPEGVAGSVEAVDEVPAPHSGGEGHDLAAVGAADRGHAQSPRSRASRLRSKPETTSPSTTMTGTAIRPVLASSSSRAAWSSATFFAVYGTP